MNIRIADQQDFTEVMSFYDAMCRELGKRDFLHAGNQGGYPSADMVRAAIHESGLIIGEEQGKIIAAIILNHDADPAYSSVKWRTQARPEQVTIMHALRVSPEFSGRGYGKRMVDYCIARAKSAGQKAVGMGDETPKEGEEQAAEAPFALLLPGQTVRPALRQAVFDAFQHKQHSIRMFPIQYIHSYYTTDPTDWKALLSRCSD